MDNVYLLEEMICRRIYRVITSEAQDAEGQLGDWVDCSPQELSVRTRVRARMEKMVHFDGTRMRLGTEFRRAEDFYEFLMNAPSSVVTPRIQLDMFAILESVPMRKVLAQYNPRPWADQDMVRKAVDCFRANRLLFYVLVMLMSTTLVVFLVTTYPRHTRN